MTDMKASVKISFYFMGEEATTDMYINWQNDYSGCDYRVLEWFRNEYNKGMARYAEICKPKPKPMSPEEQAERELLAKLQEKYKCPTCGDDREGSHYDC